MRFKVINVKNFLENYYSIGSIDLVPVEKGEWSQTYFYTVREEKLVFRLSDTPNNFKLDEYAYRFNSNNLPIPEVLDIGKFESGYYSISRKLEGKYIEDFDKSELIDILPSILNMLDRLRNIDVSDNHGYGGWDGHFNGEYKSWKDYLLAIGSENQNSLIKGWRKNLENNPEQLSKFNHIHDKLKKNIDMCSEERHIIHGDLLHFNLLIKDSKVSAVLDWGCAKYGDCLYEIAWFIFWSKTRWHKNMQNIDFVNIFTNYFNDKNFIFDNYEQRIHLYCLHIALDSIAYLSYVKNWDFIDEVADFTIDKFC